MRLLLTYIKKYRKTLVGALILAAVNQVFSLADPQIFRLIIDNYATRYGEMSQADFMTGVLWLLAAGILAALISRIAKNFQDYYVNAVSQKVGTALYADMIEHAFSLPYRIFEDQRSGELLQKADKARNDAQKFIASFVNIIFLAVLGMGLVTAYALYVHWLVGVVYIAIVPLLGLTTLVISRRVRTASQKIVAETASLAGATTETLRNVELVKSLGLERQETARLNGVNEQILGLELKKITLIRTLSFIQGTMVNATRSALLLLMLWLIYNGQISLGEFFTLMFYSFAVFSPLYELGNVVSQYQEASASLGIAQEVFNQEPEEKPERPVIIDSLSSLSFENVSFSYGEEKDSALREVSFQVQKGKSIAFAGLSGSGKSTIIKLLVGLYRPQQGKVLINGTVADQVDIEAWRKNIGYVSQDTQLFAGTIGDNLRFIKPDASDQECLAALEQAEIKNLVDKSPLGLNSRIGEGGLKLSGGEKQRLAIARALLRKPQLIIFDEATSSLDSLTELKITETIETISQQNKDLLLVMIAHRLSTVSKADTIHVLEKGRIIERGSHQELLKNGSLYSAMWRQQQAQS